MTAPLARRRGEPYIVIVSASRLRRKLDPEAGRFVVNCWSVTRDAITQNDL